LAGEVQQQGSFGDYVRGYVGTWPRPFALFDTFFGRPTTQFDNEGIARNDGLFDLWQRRLDDFFLFAFSRDVLLEVGPQLAMVEPERPAQIRLQIDDLSDKQIATSVTAIGYMQSRAASTSGARFMNSLVSQLHVPPAEAREVAERLVGGKFACPLGGDYALDNAEELPAPGEVASATGNNAPNARSLWVSTATPPENRFYLTQIPADYEMPLMKWFRGTQVEVARADDAFTLHADLDMVRIEVAPPTDAPTAGGFKLPSLGSLFGGSEAKKDDQVKPAAASEDVPPPSKK
jgi:hypothetical protein